MRITKDILLAAASGLLLQGCVEFQENQLYIDTGNSEEVFYSSSEIYADYFTSEAWVTEGTDCVSVTPTQKAAYRGDLGLHLQWDKTSEGCPWLGLGFGWDNWTGKDLSKVKNNGAIEFYVRMKEGERANLPWAIGLEDFTGSQAWLGMQVEAIKAEKITDEWTRIELPLSEFNWIEQSADASNIKQILFQFEADGELYMDEINIVPYEGGFRQRAHVFTLSGEDQMLIDGKKGDAIWNTTPQFIGDDKIYLAIQNNKLLIAAEVNDPNPAQNNQTGENIFNGDALEFAFSTDSEVDPKRPYLLSSDVHIGFAIGDKITAWNWRSNQPVKAFKAEKTITDSGYIFEAAIDLKAMDISLRQEALYGLEIAIDRGDINQRHEQSRWNSKENPDFNKSPSLWGEMYLVPAEINKK